MSRKIWHHIFSSHPSIYNPNPFFPSWRTQSTTVPDGIAGMIQLIQRISIYSSFPLYFKSRIEFWAFRHENWKCREMNILLDGRSLLCPFAIDIRHPPTALLLSSYLPLLYRADLGYQCGCFSFGAPLSTGVMCCVFVNLRLILCFRHCQLAGNPHITFNEIRTLFHLFYLIQNLRQRPGKCVCSGCGCAPTLRRRWIR